MRRLATIIIIPLLICSCAVAELKFTATPIATQVREQVKISFAVSEPTDVEVAVLDAKGRVVRHLAAGLLGENAPLPLKKSSLKQELYWGGKDDLGNLAEGGPFRVRVSIGARPVLEKIVGWDGNTLGTILGLAVGKQGEVYVLLGDGTWGRSEFRVLDRSGKYLRTIMPYPANTPRERSESVGHLIVEGERIPIVFNGHGHNLHPLVSGMKKQTMAFSPKGYVLVASAVGTLAEHGMPRHILAFHPEGGAPEGVGFVGPQIRKARNFLGGAGEAWTRWFDHLATSPDGKWIYLTIFKLDDKKPHHAVFRMKFSDQELGEPFLGTRGEVGSDDAHFNDPQGIATDSKGNIYVCDRGNSRVMVFTPEGKLLGRFAVNHPEQIAVHPATGELYIVSRKDGNLGKGTQDTKLLKFSSWGSGTPRELARIEPGTIEVMALDAGASPAKLWVALYGRPMALRPIVDKGASFELGEPVNNDKGLRYPMFLAGDPARNRVLLREKDARRKPIYQLNLASGEKVPFLPGTDVALDRQGNIYVMDGYGTNSLSRYDAEGNPLPFPGIGSHKMGTGKYRGYGPNMGLRGFCVSLDGDIYLIRSNNYQYGGIWDNNGVEGTVDVFGPDGEVKKRGLVNGLGHGDCGLGVDAAGNVYVGMNIKPPEARLPEYFRDRVPDRGWVWWRRGKREAPWDYPYYNAYLFHLGSVVKFGPTGGQVYGFGGKPSAKEGEPEPQASPLISVENAPPGALAFRSGYLKREVRVVGAHWRYCGVGIIPTSDLNWGDPCCVCLTSRLVADEYGRVFAANCFRFGVEMLDTNANLITRIGHYGNADSAGTGSKVPEPQIAFAWPAFVSVANGKLYVSDSVNRRVTVVRFDHEAVAECKIP